MVTKKDIALKTQVYSWSVKIDFMLDSRSEFSDVDVAKLSLLWKHDLILTLEPRKIHPHFEDSGVKGYRLIVNATDTASDAESIGIKVAYSLLKFCIDRRWGVSLSWPDSPLPCRVIDRLASNGISFQAFGSQVVRIALNDFVDAIEDFYSGVEDVPYNLLLSMEIFASSHFESNERTRLILIVSALEALAHQRDLSSALTPLIAQLKQTIDAYELDVDIKNSLKGQVEGIKRESVRKAIKRLLTNKGMSRDDIRFVEEAYGVRSKIVHEGRRVPELNQMCNRLEQILRDVYISL